ncbi:junction-mediating and -regulatory protein-like [Apus apus]|uniref:junction-mediating and -regulatory protein-like n=1 Tax=Apus apus TaxID=8895 RepID=UPI0021F8D58E|nr:junction-mediating and -regulatory protein-like [Apus apus]
MSAFALEETLEADWVAVRPHAFQEREKHKFVFIVAWNEIECKFAITCHNRTAQLQRSGSRVLYRGSSSGPEARAAPKAGIPTVSRGTDSGLVRGSEQDAAAEALLKSPLRAKSSPAQRLLRGPEVAGAAEEVEALELGKRKEEVEAAAAAASSLLPPSLLQAAESVAPDAEPVGEECSWAGLFSFQDLRAVHQQLCSVNSELEPYLPAFPEEPSGMWVVLFGAPKLSEQEMEDLCYKLQVYLLHSLDTCGWKILSQVLFTETGDPEEYYESLSELRQKGYEEVLQQARRRIQEISVENDYLGPRRIESLQKEDADWQRKAHMAVLSIQDLTVKYFEITAKAQKAVYDRMRADQKKIGKAAWAAAVERMEKLQYAVSKETLQLMRAKEICLEQKKHALKEERARSAGRCSLPDRDETLLQYLDLPGTPASLSGGAEREGGAAPRPL